METVAPPQQHHRVAGAHGVAVKGCGDGPIEIVDYDPRWPASYAAECERLAPVLAGVRISHIGSTAVLGLAAKPIIDMIALVDDLDANVAAVIQGAGYELPARFNVNLVHRAFLCYPSCNNRTHHLHLVDDREAMDQCLRFRDALRSDPTLASEYAALKRALAALFGDRRESYTRAKSAFIEAAARGAPSASGSLSSWPASH